MNSLVEKIDGLIEKHSLLKHPFYVQWSEGKLSSEALYGYSKEYFQLVKSVPSFVGSVLDNSPNSNEIRIEIKSLQKEEIDHIPYWERFSSALGVPNGEIKNYSGLKKTRRALEKLALLMDTFEGGAAAMYTMEQEIPQISETKIDGLIKFYSLTSDDALDYFRLHTEADIRHAETWRQILRKSSVEQEEDLFNVAKESLSAHNSILDSCYEEYC